MMFHILLRCVGGVNLDLMNIIVMDVMDINILFQERRYKMGVMSCRRNGCDNIMCNRYSYEYGYICNDCFEELLQSRLSISEFMDTHTHKFKYNRFDEMDREFPDVRKEETE
jgi:hypothetical protein